MVSETLGLENLFLILLGLIWIVGAVLQDLRRREVDNLWNFLLVAFALAYRFAFSISTNNYWFVLNGIIGFALFVGLGNLFYYSKLFAGGDAKLVMALGVVLPLSYNWLINFKIFGAFILLFLIAGSIYALIWAFSLVVVNWKRFSKEFVEQWKSYQKMFFIACGFALIWMILVFLMNQIGFLLIGLLVLLFPILFVFSKSVEESCMVKAIKPSQVTEGDWLYEDILVGGKKIKSNWEGVSARELSLIRRKYRKKILVKFGVPFTPAFLFAFVALLWLLLNFGNWF